MDSQNKMLDLLGQAYQAVDNFDHIYELMDRINDYLFEDGNATISKNIPQFAGFDPHIEQHISQINKLMDKQVNDNQLGLSMGNHAQLIFANDGRILTANSHAQSFLNQDCSGIIDDLPFDSNSISTIKQIFKQIASGMQNIRRIIYLRIEGEQSLSAFGYCRIIPVKNDELGLHIGLSHFEWSPSIFTGLENALGLSANEGQILQGVLNGKSRAEIAAECGRSINTIKTQARAVLQKAGCQNLNELAHLCSVNAYVTGLSNAQTDLVKIQPVSATPKHSMYILPLKGGRELAYYEYGDPQGRPILYFHGFYQGPYFLDDMKRKFLSNGLRIIAPSRPSFGYTSPPLKNDKYVDTVTKDVQALAEHLQLKDNIAILSHHAGSGYAFRYAATMANKISGMVLVGGGIPLTDEHIKYMGTDVRMASVASRHAPSIMRMLTSLVVKSSLKKGINSMLDKSYNQILTSAYDKIYLTNGKIRPTLINGLQHLFEQGVEGFMQDGQAQMLNWDAEYKAVECSQAWVMGRHCPLMGAHFVDEYVNTDEQNSVDIIEDIGFNVMFHSFDLILEKINQIPQLSETIEY